MREKIYSLWERDVIPLILAAIISLTTFFLICPQIINPGYTDWLLTTEDGAQHYIGWKFYRHDKWHFPITTTKNIFYNKGASIIYTDSIPLLAVPCKLISGYLPEKFQYFGLWYLISMLLMGIISYKLLRKLNVARLATLFSGLFFVLSPPMIFRMAIHDALTGQWIILLALYIYFSSLNFKKRTLGWMGIFIIAISVHAYFAAMILFIWIADILKLKFSNKIWQWKESFLHFFIVSSGILIYLFVLGMFGSHMIAGGYGYYSANLNTFFNPLEFSQILKGLPYGTNGQSDGYAYLGMGMILMLLMCLGLLLLEHKYKLKEIWLKHWPLIIMIFSSFLFAISNNIYINKTMILSFKNPGINILSEIFRSSGRFVWPAFYCIYIMIIFILSKKTANRYVLGILFVAICIQVIDIYPLLKTKHDAFVDKRYESSIRSNDWNDFASKYKFVEVFGLGWEKQMIDIADWAANNGLKINTFYFARQPVDYVKTFTGQKQDFEMGNVRPDTLYINPDIQSLKKFYNAKTDFLGTVDNLLVYAPMAKTM